MPAGAPSTRARISSSPSCPPPVPRAARSVRSRAPAPGARRRRRRAGREAEVEVARRHPPQDDGIELHAQACGVLAGDRDRRCRSVARADPQVGPLVEKGKSHRAATGAYLVGARARGELEGDLHEQLVSGRGIKTRASTATSIYRNPLRREDVGHGLTGHAPPDALAEEPGRARGHPLPMSERSSARSSPSASAEQQLRVEGRRVASRRIERRDCRANGLPRPRDLPKRLDHPFPGEAASSLRRFSSASRAAVNSSSSPASTRAISPLLSFTRWSVTRSCGKL